MPVWQWLLDAAGVALGIAVLYGIALIIRRRVLSRYGGTFELSHRVRTDKAGRGWVLGLGRYEAQSLEWFRIFSLSPRPKRVWQRGDLTYTERRQPGGVEQLSLYPDHVVITCTTRDGVVELALSSDSLMGFQSWLEAAPPGTSQILWLPVLSPSPDPLPGLLARRARNAVAAVFVLNGLLFATLFSRIPDLREDLDLSNGGLGLLLLAISVGSLLGLPASGKLIERLGAAGVVRGGAVLTAVGFGVAAVGASALTSAPVVALGLGLYGFGTGTWDVAMNVEGADVERRLGRTVMPRFHAGFSFGAIGGAGVGVLAARFSVPIPVHFMLISLAALAAVLVLVRAFTPVAPPEDSEEAASGRSAWLEPRTLAIGTMVLAFTLAEGAAGDWLALALVDGYDARHFVGVAGFALFVTAMTTGRMVGPILLDRFGRVPVLLGSAAAALVGLLMVILGGHPAYAMIGIVVWGLGAALGFPVGMSAAADDPRLAARRVAVVSTIGYGAFLAGPPLLGFVGDQVGTLDSLLVVAAAMVPAAVLVLAVRRPRVAAADAHPLP